MPGDFTLPQLDERVLSTLNADGSRRWIDPKAARGPLHSARAVVAWTLIAIFTALPWLRMDGKPPILLDVMTRHFTVFGTTFRPTETLLLALLLLAVFVSVFLATAILGRVWCGWGCPQTVYLEFVYRPLERLVLGTGAARSGGAATWRRIALYALFLLISAHLANTFLAYFVGTDRLVQWTFRSPAEHPAAFAVFAITTGLMMFDFVFFREQLCTLVCPYGRFQSVLLDRDSLIVTYDPKRGEPRANAVERRAMAAEGKGAGDCIECSWCQQVCPTGIDIRDGLQLECIHCTQCIDACNTVMEKVGKPKGLIRYSTQNRIDGLKARVFRYRIAIYVTVLCALVTALILLLDRRAPVLVEQSRMIGVNFTELPGGVVRSPVRLLLENRTEADVWATVRGTGDVQVEGGETRALIPALEAMQVDMAVTAPASSFGRGSRSATLRVEADGGFTKDVNVRLAGPFGGASS
jgi:cytochrome c oxidase accessory protein FixG